jgi:peptidoglycan/xylan/chitin deacetylase (PgdA/CDA1 family)
MRATANGSGDSLVLCYHAVSETWSADLSAAPEAIERQLATLVERGYGGATFSQVVRGVPGPTVAVTFDDAYRSVYERALPILERLGLPATVFVPTAHVDATEPMAWEGIDRWIGGPHEGELLCMGREQLQGLAAHGWEIGSHTHTHPRLTRLAPAELSTELKRSRALLEEWLGLPCRSLAYPYGDVSASVAKAARDAGYTAAATLDAARRSNDPLLWPRIGVYHRDSQWRFRLKVAPLVRRAGLGRLRHPIVAFRGLRAEG